MSLDDTVGAETADAYLSVADADALADQDLGPEADAWKKADLGLKESAIKRATREIDGYLEGPAPRVAYYPGVQALYFPRVIDVGDEGDPLIPRRVRLATYQQATYILKNKDALATMNAHRSRNGSAEPDSAYGTDPANGPSILAPMALHYLAGFARASRGGATLRSVPVSGPYAGPYPPELLP